MVDFEELKNTLGKAISQFPDKRTGKNLQYSMSDIGMSAFSIFFTQSPSFLAYQQLMTDSKGISNAKTLFGISKIPTDNHVRTILDEVSPKYLNSVFEQVDQELLAKEELKGFFGVNNSRLIALDGTWYFSSDNIHCDECSSIKHANGNVTYYHSAITPVVVAPGYKVAIPLAPEFIRPQDGNKKQDCEINASKRWIEHYKDNPLCQENATILGDDLYSRNPFCKQLINSGFHFLLVCKPSSHKWLTDWINGLEYGNDLAHKVINQWNGKSRETWTYRFANNVPLADSDETLMVNWAELTITNDKGRVLYRNAFVTDHVITDGNVEAVVLSGRTRWKIENENNNTLKTKGYNLEHNFGHGKKHLSSLLAAMNILAFLFHTFLEFADGKYKELRQKLGARKRFFQHIRALTCYVCFRNWELMLDFMIDAYDNPIEPEDIAKYSA